MKKQQLQKCLNYNPLEPVTFKVLLQCLISITVIKVQQVENLVNFLPVLVEQPLDPSGVFQTGHTTAKLYQT